MGPGMTSQPRARARSLEEMRDMGRKAAAALRSGAFVGEAALAAGIPERTYYEWLDGRDDAALAFQAEVMPAYYEQARAAQAQAESDIGGGEKGPSGPHASYHKWLMEKRWPKVFGAARIELTGKDGGPIQHQDVASMPTDELVALVGKAEEGEE